MEEPDLLGAVADAADANRSAQASASKAADAQRQAIYAALDAGHSITETYRAAGITRARINQLIQDRKKAASAE